MGSLIPDPSQENQPGSDLGMRSEPISLKAHAASEVSLWSRVSCQPHDLHPPR